MKLVSALSLGVFAVLATSAVTALGAGQGGNQVTHFRSSGDTASFTAFEGDSYVSAAVHRSGSGNNTSTFLSYYSASCTYDADSYSCTGMDGWGIIPNGDFQVHGGSGSADLVTDLSGITGNSYSYGCDYVTMDCSFSESPWQGGGQLIASWTKNSMYTYSHNGQSTADYLNYRYSTQGKSQESSADVQGSLLGVPFSAPNGFIGTSFDRVLTIEKIH